MVIIPSLIVLMAPVDVKQHLKMAGTMSGGQPVGPRPFRDHRSYKIAHKSKSTTYALRGRTFCTVGRLVLQPTLKRTVRGRRHNEVGSGKRPVAASRAVEQDVTMTGKVMIAGALSVPTRRKICPPTRSYTNLSRQLRDLLATNFSWPFVLVIICHCIRRSPFWVSRELAKSLFLQQLNTVSIRFCWKRLRSAAVLCVVNLALSNLHGTDFALPTIPKPNKFHFYPHGQKE